MNRPRFLGGIFHYTIDICKETEGTVPCYAGVRNSEFLVSEGPSYKTTTVFPLSQGEDLCPPARCLQRNRSCKTKIARLQKTGMCHATCRDQ